MENNMSSINNVIDFNNYCNIKDNQEIIKNKSLREFKGYYEYCYISSYEEKYPDFESDSIQLEDIFVTILKANGKMSLVSILFPKNKFNIEKIKDWLKTYKVDFFQEHKNNLTIKNAESIVSGFLYYGDAIILSVKGKKALTFETNNFIEVTEEYKEYPQYVNLAHSKNINFENSNEGFSIIYNGNKMMSIPRIEFNKKKDIIISNGNLIYADYIDMFNGLLGFFNIDYPQNPVSCVADNNTQITIDTMVKPDGTKICIIEYNYIIYAEKL